MDEQLEDAIAFYLFRERMLNMGNPFYAFSGFFSQEAIEKRKEKQPTEDEALMLQHRQNAEMLIKDFSLAWGVRPEMLEVAPGVYATGIKEDYGPTPQDLSEYRAAQRKDAVVLSGNGFTVTFDEYGNVIFRTSNGMSAFTGAQYEELRQLMINAPSASVEVPTAYGYQGGGPVVSSSSHTPAMKSQTELVAELHGTARENEERAQYSIKMQRESGVWGSRRGDT